jgi:hypothetical protein
MTKAGIAARSTGEVDMVVAGPDNALLYYRLTGGQNVPNPLTIAPSGSLSSAPAIVVRSSGEVDVVAKGPYNELLYYWASPTVSWSIATIAPAGSIVSAPAIAVSPQILT